MKYSTKDEKPFERTVRRPIYHNRREVLSCNFKSLRTSFENLFRNYVSWEEIEAHSSDSSQLWCPHKVGHRRTENGVSASTCKGGLVGLSILVYCFNSDEFLLLFSRFVLIFIPRRTSRFRLLDDLQAHFNEKQQRSDSRKEAWSAALKSVRSCVLVWKRCLTSFRFLRFCCTSLARNLPEFFWKLLFEKSIEREMWPIA